MRNLLDIQKVLERRCASPARRRADARTARSQVQARGAVDLNGAPLVGPAPVRERAGLDVQGDELVDFADRVRPEKGDRAFGYRLGLLRRLLAANARKPGWRSSA